MYVVSIKKSKLKINSEIGTSQHPEFSSKRIDELEFIKTSEEFVYKQIDELKITETGEDSDSKRNDELKLTETGEDSDSKQNDELKITETDEDLEIGTSQSSRKSGTKENNFDSEIVKLFQDSTIFQLDDNWNTENKKNYINIDSRIITTQINLQMDR